MLDKLIQLIDKVGVEWAVAIASVGAVGWYLGKDVLPWVGNQLVAVGKWVEPYAGRYFDLKLKHLECQSKISAAQGVNAIKQSRVDAQEHN